MGIYVHYVICSVEVIAYICLITYMLYIIDSNYGMSINLFCIIYFCKLYSI